MTKFIFTLVFVFIFQLNFAQSSYSVYFGNLHSHTSNSDGSGTPSDAFAYARDSAGLDFLAVTDHMEQIFSFTLNSAIADAEDATNTNFLGIVGYEWGSPVYGHCNVFNTTEMPSVLTYTEWSDFRNWMMDNHPPAFAQFNHPGDEVTFNNWYDFEYKGAETDSCFQLIEFQNIQEATEFYEMALNNGWHLSPVWNQDNHSPDWGNKNDGRAGIWATDLIWDALVAAINQGRTFATMDKNASVWMEAGGYEMGQTALLSSGDSIQLVLDDEDDELFSLIELVGSSGVISSLNNLSSGTYNLSLDLSNTSYVFLRTIQEDGDYLWSAPLYIDWQVTGSRDLISSVDYTVYPNPSSGKFYIEAPETEYKRTFRIEVYDLNGKKQLFHKCSCSLNTRVCVDMSNLEPGIYFMSIDDQKQNSMHKIVVQ